MIIYPAIDIKDGCCVRLFQGAYETANKVADDPVETARSFRARGADHLHLVDLDGARDGVRKNREIILNTVKAFDGLVEVGGGIRTMEDIADYLSNGVDRVILGSVAFRDRTFLKKAAFLYGDQLAVGVDARDGYITVHGWTETSTTLYTDFARDCESLGIETLIFTDVGRDGMLSGPNYEQLADLQKTVGCDIIASGGVRDIENVEKLASMKLYGAICGMSIYSGTLDLAEAVNAAK